LGTRWNQSVDVWSAACLVGPFSLSFLKRTTTDE